MTPTAVCSFPSLYGAIKPNPFGLNDHYSAENCSNSTYLNSSHSQPVLPDLQCLRGLSEIALAYLLWPSLLWS